MQGVCLVHPNNVGSDAVETLQGYASPGVSQHRPCLPAPGAPPCSEVRAVEPVIDQVSPAVPADFGIGRVWQGRQKQLGIVVIKPETDALRRHRLRDCRQSWVVQVHNDSC